MSRLTITLDDDLHQSLKEAAARQGCTIENIIIVESLRLRGIRSIESARDLLEKARAHSGMDDDALALALEETAKVREQSA